MYFAQEIENLLIYFYNIINSILFSFLVLFKELVVLEPDRNNVGILLCTVKATEWFSVSLVIDGKEIGIIFYNDSSFQNSSTVDLFVPVFSLVSSDEVRVSLNASLENMNLTLCSTLLQFTCFVTSKHGSGNNGGQIQIAGKNNTRYTDAR